VCTKAPPGYAKLNRDEAWGALQANACLHIALDTVSQLGVVVCPQRVPGSILSQFEDRGLVGRSGRQAASNSL